MSKHTFTWDQTNDLILEKTIGEVERFRRFLASYTKFVIVGNETTLALQEFLARRLIVNQSKNVAWLTGPMHFELQRRDGADYLESFVYDQGSPKHLCILLVDRQDSQAVERAMQFCAENFYPCLIVSKRSREENSKMDSFNFPSRVYSLVLESDSNQQFEFAASFLFDQATTPLHDAFSMKVEK